MSVLRVFTVYTLRMGLSIIYPGIFYFRLSRVFANELNLFTSRWIHVRISELSTGKNVNLNKYYHQNFPIKGLNQEGKNKEQLNSPPYLHTIQLLPNYLHLSYDVASGSEITPCNKICKPLVVYRFSGNVMTSIKTLRI